MRGVIRLDKNTGEKLQEYESAIDAEKWLKENGHKGKYTLILETCKGSHQSSGGFGWKFISIVDLPNEEWLPIPKNILGVTGLWVSDKGRVKDGYTIRLQCTHKKGYKQTKLNWKVWRVHRLVAIVFIPNPNNLPEVDHIDEDKSNNVVTNLRWSTTLDNITHSLGKKVAKCDLEGNILETFLSASAASRSIGKPNNAICKVCNGKQKIAYGFTWKYN